MASSSARPSGRPNRRRGANAVRLHQRVRARGRGRPLPLTEVGDRAVLTGDDDEPVRVDQPDRVAHHLQGPLDDRPVTPEDPPALGEMDALRTATTVGEGPGCGRVVVHHHVAVRAEREHPFHQVLDLRRVPVRHEQVGEPPLAFGRGRPRARRRLLARPAGHGSLH